LALDHRGNLRNALNPKDPKSIPFNELVEFKRQVVSSLAPQASAVLLDPEIGAAQVIAGEELPGNVGLLVSVEETGYTGGPAARLSRVQPGWSVGKIRRMGASAVKLLVYYHPDAPQAPEQENLVSQVAEACSRQDLPLFLEPLSFSLDPLQKKLPASEIKQVVVETARRLTPLGADILKAEFPLDIKPQPDEADWLGACRELTDASDVPWVLLSAGVDFETFLLQVQVACKAGASGVLAGRAIWKEATELEGQERLDFLWSTAADRMLKTRALCDAFAKPYSDFHTAENEPLEGWYSQYPDF
jgi:tagatose-1,6-bisphosphate aldolase